jgi:hypothetical protein
VEEVQKDCRSGILRGIVPELCSSPDAEYMIVRKIINWCGTRPSV